jgi:hypothetical protein
MWEWAGRIKSTWSWARFAWQLAIFFGLSGFLASVAGSITAVIQGVPVPIALMVGYCTLVGAIYMAMAPLAFRVLSAASGSVPKKDIFKPNYAAVRLMHEYTLKDASHLWCDIDQNGKNTRESEAWYQALTSAIQRGELEFEPKITAHYGRELRNPEWSTRIPREALKKYAAKINQDPIFLRDS